MKWRGRTGGGNFGQRSMFAIVKCTDIRFCYLLLRLIVPFFMIGSYKNCLAIYRYFRKRHYYSIWKSWRKTYKNHYLFGQLIFDRFAVFAGKGEKFDVEIEGNAFFIEAIESLKPVLIAGSHVGNFEIAGYLLTQNKKRVNAIVFDGEAEVMQNLRSKKLDTNNVNMIPVKMDLSHIFEINAALLRGEIVSMPCDRFFTGKKSIVSNFLGAPAVFPAGAFYIADKFDTNVLALFAMKEKAMKYKIYVCPLNMESNETNVARGNAMRGSALRNVNVEYLQRKYVDALEMIVKRYPEQWYNFYDFWRYEEK